VSHPRWPAWAGSRTSRDLIARAPPGKTGQYRLSTDGEWAQISKTWEYSTQRMASSRTAHEGIADVTVAIVLSLTAGRCRWPAVSFTSFTVMGEEGALGDWFQTIVDVQVTPQASEALAADVLGWLISSGVVSAERTDCVLDSDLGYPPGPRSDEAVDASGWSGRWQDGWTNGLDITTGSTVFHSGQGGPEAVTCPHCLVKIELDDEAWDASMRS
jgi:hypothetical protein